jgi:molybdenum cofactor synthesis domain-containing protein
VAASGEGRPAVVMTVSDGAAAGVREDTSGAALETRLLDAGWRVGPRITVPDEVDQIGSALRSAATAGAALIVTTGGTGFGPRDVTPEATLAVATRRAPGLAERMRAVGREITPMADLSRAEVVVLGATLVVNTPGSRKGAVESLDAVLDLLPHATQLLGGQTQQHPIGHGTQGVPHASPASHHVDAHVTEHAHNDDDPCALAHADGVPDDRRPGTLVAVYASPLSSVLLSWGRDLGYRRLVLVDPDPERAQAHHAAQHADLVAASLDAAAVDDDTDVVITDHDRDQIVDVCDAMLRSDARWLGLMGSARHTGPHVDGLRVRGFTDAEIGRIERPVGLDIGSRTPPEIALAILAGLVADRQGRR